MHYFTSISAIITSSLTISQPSDGSGQFTFKITFWLEVEGKKLHETPYFDLMI